MPNLPIEAHPAGEASLVKKKTCLALENTKIPVSTFNGLVHDRCRILARTVGLIYNWWKLFVRIAEPNKHMEAITSRPLLLHSIGKEISHAGQTCIQITSIHGSTGKVQKLLDRVATFFGGTYPDIYVGRSVAQQAKRC